MAWPPATHDDVTVEIDTNRDLSRSGNATLFETMLRSNVIGATALTSGVLYGTAVTAHKRDVTLTGLAANSGATAAATVTTARLGLFQVVSSDELKLLAETANDTTLFTATQTYYGRALDAARGGPTSITLIQGTRYVLGFIVVATTMPTIRGSGPPASLLDRADKIAYAKGSQTDFPAIGASLTAWAGLSGVFWMGGT